MLLDYHLALDSPLRQPDTFRRVTHEPKHYFIKKHIDNWAARGAPRGILVFADNQFNAIEALTPKHSLMTQEEADALLTEAGTVWFLTHATELDLCEAARFCEAGTPWPLRPLDDDLQWANGFLKQKQIVYLSRLFQPAGRHTQIIIELEANGWEAPNQPEGGPVKQVRAYWKHVAEEVGKDVETVRCVAIALYIYYCCLQNFVKQVTSS